MDLDELDREVAARVSNWQAAGARWEVKRGRVTDKPSSSLCVETGEVLAELVLWVSGEAELIYARVAGGEIVCEHYDITTLASLRGCLDNLEAYTGLRMPPFDP
jgi:hypothetical protein